MNDDELKTIGLVRQAMKPIIKSLFTAEQYKEFMKSDINVLSTAILTEMRLLSTEMQKNANIKVNIQTQAIDEALAELTRLSKREPNVKVDLGDFKKLTSKLELAIDAMKAAAQPIDTTTKPQQVFLVDEKGKPYNFGSLKGKPDIQTVMTQKFPFSFQGNNIAMPLITVSGVLTLPVANPDGSFIAAGGGGGGGSTNGLTDAQLRASAVTTSGTVGGTVQTIPQGITTISGSVYAVDLDIRNLTFAADKVDVSGSTLASETFTKKTVTAASSGNNTIHTPASGKKIRLYFFGYSAGSNVTGVLVGMRFAPAGTIFDNQYFVAPGQPYARNIQAGKRYVDGGVDETLVVNLSAAQTVYVNVEIDEI